MSKKYSTKEAVELMESWGTPFTEGTLAVWRCRKEGPSYIKIRNKVFYTEESLRRFTTGLVIKTVDSEV
jgi:hypothetical protein